MPNQRECRKCGQSYSEYAPDPFTTYCDGKDVGPDNPEDCGFYEESDDEFEDI